MNVWMSIDSTGYEEKPKKDIGIIRNRSSNNWGFYDLKKVADLIGNNGFTFVPAHLTGGTKESNFTEMQLFVLDFDGGISFQEVKGICDRYGIRISFAYKTMTASETIEKFRVVFIYECLIREAFVARVIMSILHKLFPQADPKCKSLDRMFFGGKELFYFDESACVALVQLLIPLMEKLETGDNYHRNCKNFCKKNNIAMYNNIPMIIKTDQINNYDGIMDSNNIYTIGESTYPSFSIYKGFTETLSKSKRRRENHKTNLNDITNCELLNDFFNGEELEHGAKFAIITNLLQINGGEKKFFEVLEETDYDSYLRWKRAMKYMAGYGPQSCSEEFCPYYGKCHDDGTIVNTLIQDRKVYVEDENLYPLEEAREQMYENLMRAIHDTNDGIHLIKAQTAIGKTHTYIDVVSNLRHMKFIIAVPTNKLKNEVEKRFLDGNVYMDELYVTASTKDNPFLPKEIQDEIEYYHSIGLHNQTKKILKAYKKELEGSPYLAAIKECEKIITGPKDVQARIIVTTHAYLKELSEEVLAGRTIIIDEDILMLDFFTGMKEISISTLENIANANNYVFSDRAKILLSSTLNYVESLTPESATPEETAALLDYIEYYSSDNVGDIIEADTFVRCLENETKKEVVRYYCAPKLKKTKYIILSATLNEDIYRKYFYNQMRVYTYPEKKAAYKGKLVQYTYESLSRTKLKNRLHVFNYACEMAGDSQLAFITFKKYKEYLKGKTNFNFTELHFGNTSGIDKYKGHDLGIVGTYFKLPEEYKLIAKFLGGNPNGEQDKYPHQRRVQYKNKSFLIATYDDPILQEVQLYQIESEMEQSVGRARLLNEDCTVYLFSSFPCEQAEINIKNYLKDYKIETTVS